MADNERERHADHNVLQGMRKPTFDPAAECRCRTGNYCHRHRAYGVDDNARDMEIASRFVHNDSITHGRRKEMHRHED